MRIHISDTVQILDADNLRALDAQTALPCDAAAQKLQESGLGTVEADHAWLDIVELRQRGQRLSANDNWAAEFDGMIAYARKMGWCNDDNGTVRAHFGEG